MDVCFVGERERATTTTTRTKDKKIREEREAKERKKLISILTNTFVCVCVCMCVCGGLLCSRGGEGRVAMTKGGKEKKLACWVFLLMINTWAC